MKRYGLTYASYDRFGQKSHVLNTVPNYRGGRRL